jgi:hypothetical protein
MISTPKSLGFFGHREDQAYCHNDFRVFNEDKWSYIQCDVPAFSHHVAVWDPNSSKFVVSDGVQRDGYSSDIYRVDIGASASAKTTATLRAEGMPLLSGHSISAMLPTDFVFSVNRSPRTER